MKKALLIFILVLVGCYLLDNDAKTTVYSTASEKNQTPIGTIVFKDTPQGLLVDVNLNNLSDGKHGFHIHEFGSCEADYNKESVLEPALKSGGHYDPDKTGKHLGPDKKGHKGDLPVLEVSKNGDVKTKFYVPDLSVRELRHRSVIIHEGGDNYSDSPKPLGRGGKRIACGVIE